MWPQGFVRGSATKTVAVIIACASAGLLWSPAQPAFAAQSVTFRSAVGSTASATNKIILTMPSGVVSTDVLVAEVAVSGGTGVTITAPTGWTLIRTDTSSTSIAEGLYYRVATSSEPASYQWNFSSSQSAAGGIGAYIGVDNTTPVDVSSGQGSTSNGKTITAPSVTTVVANEMLIGFFSTGKNQAITPQTGMTERWDVTPGSTIEAASADVLQATAGASGAKTASVGTSSAWVGQLVALRPSCSGGALSVTPPPTVSFPSTSLNGLDQIVSTTAMLATSDLTGSDAGWNITATSTTFTNGGGKTLPTSATTVTAGSPSSASGMCALPTNSVAYPLTLPAGATPPTAVKVYNAATNSGVGPSNVTLTTALAVPGNAYSGSYSSTWTFTIATGP